MFFKKKNQKKVSAPVYVLCTLTIETTFTKNQRQNSFLQKQFFTKPKTREAVRDSWRQGKRPYPTT
jgi:hypothetical protein